MYLLAICHFTFNCAVTCVVTSAVQGTIRNRSSTQLSKQDSRYSIASIESAEEDKENKRRAMLIQEEVAAQGTVKRMSRLP